MNPAEWLVRTARRVPLSPALMTGTTVVADYAGFCRRAASVGAALRRHYGVKPGERVALFMANRIEYLELLYGAWFCGASVVPINAKLHPKEAAFIVEDSAARVALVSEEMAGDLAAAVSGADCRMIPTGGQAFDDLFDCDPLDAPEPMTGDTMVWLFYTSGTTGKPKGVMISSANIQAMTYCYFIDVDSVSREDAILYAAPMSHGAGLYNFMHVLRGARHVVPRSGHFDPAEILDTAPEIGNVSMFAAPTMVRRLVDRARAQGGNGDGIKTIVYGGGPMYVADIVEAVDVMGPRFVQIYGQGESPMTITALPRDLVADRSHPNWRARLASVGLAQTAVRVRVVGEDGNDMPAGEVGEIIVSGLAVMPGYWRNREATAKTIRDGWLWTGDMGAMDEDGFVTLHDRSRDVIISGGTNIYPREVEEALLTLDGVHEVAVVGRPDPEWGEDVVAFVVPMPGAELGAADLDAHCLSLIARFKRPKAYVIVDELPKNNYGKVLKTALRERLESETAAV